MAIDMRLNLRWRGAGAKGGDTHTHV